MTKTPPSTCKILQILRNSNITQEHTSVLTYLRSNIGRENLAKTITDIQYTELCGLLLTLIMRSDGDGVCEHDTTKNEDVRMALQSVLELDNYHVNFFRILPHTDQEDRKKILKFLMNIEVKILMRLIQDSMFVDFINECLHTVQPTIMNWIAANTCKDNIQPLIQAETQTLSVEQKNEEQLISLTLTILFRIYEFAVISSTNSNIERIHPLLFERVIPLAYMGHKRQRIPALKLLNQALNSNAISHIKNKYSSLWVQYKDTLQNTYCIRMSLLVKFGDDDWANQWCLSIEMLGTDLHRGAELINNLLSVEEKAFKSTDMTVRRKAFESWTHLIDNFALNTTELTTLRRIKLLCIPLNAKNSKIEMVAIAKLNTWWHLIGKLYLCEDKSVNQVIEQFLNFCFGPLGDTPLLSTKCDVVASPGKRFTVTKLMAIDTLFQLLIQTPIDRNHIPKFIQYRLPNALPNAVFQTSYKYIFHSVGEAMLLMNELDTGELNDRKDLNAILWRNLMMYIQQSSIEHKAGMYREFILILGEVISHTIDTPLVIDLLVNVIVPQFVKITPHLIFDDTIFMDLLLKLLSPEFLAIIDNKCLHILTHLICHAMKPQNTKFYHYHTISFIKDALKKMEMLMKHELDSCVFELWCTFAGAVTKYIEQNQQINEGTATNHNFETIRFLIIFPMRNIFWCSSGPLMKIGKLWRELFKQFEMQTDLIPTVKPNEILHDITVEMEKSIIQDEGCYKIVAHCFDALISTINYETFFSQNRIPPLIKLLRDVTISALTDMATFEIELSLKATSSLLITVYGLNQKHALMYLDVMKPVFESMLKMKSVESIEKEIVNTWETVVIILRGLTKLLTHQFISSYQSSILSALRHENNKIASQAQLLFDLRADTNEEIKSSLDQIEEIFQRTPGDGLSIPQKNNEGPIKYVKIAGSFLNRKIMSPKSVTVIRNDCETKKMKMPLPPPPPSESNSQEYVMIKNDSKLDINLLTEHQKESLMRHRDDIPAMYNELSLSESRNTQQLEDWFKDKSEVFDAEKNIHEDVDDIVMIDGEANKENNLSKCVDLIDHSEKFKDRTMEKNLEEAESHAMNQLNQQKFDKISKVDTDTQICKSADDETNVPDETIKIEAKVHTSQASGGTLCFDSRGELPVGDDNTHSTTECFPQLVIEKSRVPQMLITDSGNKSLSTSRRAESDKDTESQSLELLRTTKRGRSRGRPIKVDKSSSRSTKLSNNSDDGSDHNLKRKNVFDDESEGLSVHKRRKYNSLPQSSSDTTSDAESINSTESENNMIPVLDADLPKRTKKEMSRLQINMVFNSRMPSKLRHKPVDDYIYGNKSKRQKNKNSDKNASDIGSSQELVNLRKPRETRSLPHVKADSTKANPIQLLEIDRSNKVVEADFEMKTHDDDELKPNTLGSVEQIGTYGNPDSTENTEAPECDHSGISNRVPTKNHSTIDNCNIDRAADEEEVIESSQKINSVLRSPRRRNYDAQETSHDSTIKNNPETQILHEKSHLTHETSYVIPEQLEISQKSPHDRMNETSVTGFNFSSPKTVKRLSRSKVFTPQGRAAHMLGLVTKLAIVERNESRAQIKCLEDEINKKCKYSRELEGESVKKDRTLIFKEPERIGSPSGSRQEKIFNNMKSKDYSSSPPSKLFGNLKNDGEKVSPKFEKTMLTELANSNDKGLNVENSIPSEKDELPLLEWSNANPPCLTASPSMSILKRQRQILSDIDIDAMSSRKKRVSFTDPPVSREMGYEVMSELSPIKTNKFGQLRHFLQRRDTSTKKQSRTRKDQIDLEKSNISADEKSSAFLLSDKTRIDQEESTLLTQKDNDFVKKVDECNGSVINISNDHMNQTNIHNEHVHIGSSNPEFLTSIDKVDQIDHVQSSDSITRLEMQPSSPNCGKKTLTEVQLHEIQKNCNEHEMYINHPAESVESQVFDHADSSEFNITDDSTIARILNGSDNSNKSNDLEDTVDIQNVSNLNSTANSDELFDDKLTRTSTQIAAMTMIAQSETLPVTDSMFLSQTISQDSSTTQQSFPMRLPNTMDMTDPICPTLMCCNDPIDAIVNDLVDPLWTKNLTKYLASRNINTIGQLAQLTEREVARFPVKGSPKATYVKQVLNKFLSSNALQSKNEMTEEIVETTNTTVCITSHLTKKYPDINKTSELIPDSNYDDSGNNFCTDISTTSSSLVNSSPANNKIGERNVEVAIATGQKQSDSIQSKDFGSVILDMSFPSPPQNVRAKNETKMMGTVSTAGDESSTIADLIAYHTATSTTKSETTQMKLEELLNKIDPNLLLQNAAKRSLPEDIIAQYKMKMKHKSDAEFAKDTMRILGLEMCTETELKNACHDYGLTKVLGRLPSIFNAENQFFTKVLSTYRMKITADDCINALDLNQLKKAICNKCSSSELCEMLSTVLDNEARNDINTPINEISSLNAMLKRMPMDSIISHTVANDELIPSSFVLEIALQNNNSDTITHALDAQYPDIIGNIMKRNMSVGRIVSYINESQLSIEKLLNIYRTVCDKLTPVQILDAHYKIMKDKLNCPNTNEPQ